MQKAPSISQLTDIQQRYSAPNKTQEALRVRLVKPIEPDVEIFTSLCKEIWDRSWYTNFGPVETQLIEAISNYTSCANVALVSSGTSAITVALQALKHSNDHNCRGTEVITTPYTFPATIHAIEAAGFTVRFADIDRDSLNLDPQRIEASITQDTAAIVTVPVYGRCGGLKDTHSLCEYLNIPLIFDAAHAFNTKIEDIPLHMYCDAAAYSFHSTKLFHTGEGGGILSRHSDLIKSARRLSNFGILDEETIDLPGGNAKMSEIHAAIGLAVLPSVAKEVSLRSELRSEYSEHLAELSEFIKVLAYDQGENSSEQYFAIQFLGDEPLATLNRDLAQHTLRESGIESRKYFSPSATRYTYRHAAKRHGVRSCPIAEEASSRALCLPFNSSVSDIDVKTISSTLKNNLQRSIP